MERSKVQNPFSMGPRTGRSQYQPDLQSRVPSRASFDKGLSSGAYIADALLSFAGVAGDAYVKRTAKKVEEDKIAQTTRAANMERPSNDATMAGYRAHAQIVAEQETAKEQAALALFAETANPTDKEWEERVKRGYTNIDGFMTENYEHYAKDLDMQQATSVKYREMARAASLGRIANSVGVEITQRMEASSDSLISLASSESFKEATSDQINMHINEMFKTLQLTAAQKDKVLEDAIMKSESKKLVEFAKSFKGDRSTSLYQRSGIVQKMAKKIKADELSSLALEISDLQRTNAMDYINGSMTFEEFSNQSKALNAKYDGKYMTAGQYQSIQDTRDKAMASQNVVAGIVEGIANPNISTIPGSKEQKQAGFSAFQATMQAGAEKEADRRGLEGDERDAFLLSEAKKTVAFIADRSVALGVSVQAWEDSIRHLSSLNESVVESTDAAGGAVKRLSSQATMAIELLDTMDDYTRHKYLDGMGKDGKVVKAMLDGMDLGEPPHVALSKAHSIAMRTKPINPQEVTEAVKSSMKIFNPWLSFNMPKYQRGFMEDLLYKAYAREPNPTSKRAKKMVEAHFKNGYTTLDNKVRVQGTPGEISAASMGTYSVRGEDGKLVKHKATGVGPAYISLAFKGYQNAMKEVVRHALGGVNVNQVFPVLNYRRGMMQLYSEDGPIPGTEAPMTKLEYFANHLKNSYEKAVSKELKEMTDADVRKMFEAMNIQRELRRTR